MILPRFMAHGRYAKVTERYASASSFSTTDTRGLTHAPQHAVLAGIVCKLKRNSDRRQLAGSVKSPATVSGKPNFSGTFLATNLMGPISAVCPMWHYLDWKIGRSTLRVKILSDRQPYYTREEVLEIPCINISL